MKWFHLVLLCAVACTKEQPPAKGSAPLIVLASFDTTRADAIGAYGDPDAVTPVVDGLAANGVRFEWALATLPTTLGSHTSMMSGLDTHGHRVPSNGHPVPEDVPLLADRLADAGWDRIAVVGAMPLESDMGLDRGFRVYDDTEYASVLGKPRRTADEVTDKALAAIDARPSDKPTFLFVHYYDPHSPWEAAPQAIRDKFVPASFELDRKGFDGLEVFRQRARRGLKLKRERVEHARQLYLAQVHWTDEQFGRLLDGLKTRGLMDDSLVIMTSDHGEMLNERRLGQIYTHGPDVDLPVIRVPLVVSGTGKFATPKGQVVERQARLQDIANTVLTAAGLEANLGDGEDLAAAWRGELGPPGPHYAEATRSGLNKKLGKPEEGAWANIRFERTVVDSNLALIYTPWKDEPSALYTVSAEQPEVTNPEETVRMRGLLDAWDATAPSGQTHQIDESTAEALKLLGYIE